MRHRRYRIPAWVLILLAVALTPVGAIERDFDGRSREMPETRPVPSPTNELDLSDAGLAEVPANDEIEAMALDPDALRDALGVVARFLELDRGQVEALAELLERRREAVLPLFREIGRREQLLRRLIDAGDDPALIGRVVLEIQALRGHVARVQAEFIGAFESLLDPAQRERFELIRIALRVQPVLPAFRALALL